MNACELTAAYRSARDAEPEAVVQSRTSCRADRSHMAVELFAAVVGPDLEALRILLKSSQLTKRVLFDGRNITQESACLNSILVELLQYRAAASQREAALRLLLEAAMKLSPSRAVQLLETKGQAQYSPLAIAAYRGHLECVRLLLTHGSNPNALYRGKTAVQAAEAVDRSDVAAIIKQHMKKACVELAPVVISSTR